MVAGRDRHPPQHEPQLDSGGRLGLAVVVLLILVGGLGWLVTTG